MKQLLRVFAIGISVGINGLASVRECLYSRGYIKVLALYAVFPAVLVAVIVVVVICLLACKQKLTWGGGWSSPVTALFTRGVII